MNTPQLSDTAKNPLQSLEEWDEFLKERYPEAGAAPAAKDRDEYRNYDTPERDTVREFYRLNHRYQTLEFVLEKKKEWLAFDKQRMTPWEALEYLNTLVDDSDPDTDLTQIEHLLQTSEAIRRDGHPRWFVLTGFIHDLGKVLCLWGEPQWGVLQMMRHNPQIGNCIGRRKIQRRRAGTLAMALLHARGLRP